MRASENVFFFILFAVGLKGPFGAGFLAATVVALAWKRGQNSVRYNSNYVAVAAEVTATECEDEDET